jgi:negative regulator of replication initiation
MPATFQALVALNGDAIDLLRSHALPGEDASATLLRCFRPTAAATPQPAGNGGTDQDTALLANIQSPEFRAARNATGRYLLILSYVHAAHPNDFENILRIRGRSTGRLYFGRTEAEVSRSGQQLSPMPIPRSGVYAMTNASTAKKGRILEQALRLFGYRTGTIAAVVSALETGVTA